MDPYGGGVRRYRASTAAGLAFLLAACAACADAGVLSAAGARPAQEQTPA
jgi:hypothetical protein